MGGQIDWVELFFSSTGRVARTPFLIAAAVLIAIAMVYEASMGPTMHLLTGWFVYPGLLFSACCVLSKRLHDRGRSGWLTRWAADAPVQAGIAGASSHSGRRTFITTLANKGISVRVLAGLAGHKSIAVTQKYIDVNPDLMRNAVELI